jgi:RNA recognition motif-containing protein
MNHSNNAGATTVPVIQQPNATLYIKNIDWKIKKGLLRRALYSLFTRHGKVLDIITLRKDGLRGQAFVIMESVSAATAALQAEQGFTFFQKDMVIEYARTKSDMIAKRDGDYIPKAQRLRQQQQQQQQQQQRNKILNTEVVDDAMNTEVTDMGGTTTLSIAPQPSVSDDTVAINGTDTVDATTTTTTTTSVAVSVTAVSFSTTPTSTLIAYQLPIECNEIMLHILFQQYSGYQPPVRMMTSTTTNIATDDSKVPPYGIIAFDSVANATTAYNALNGFQLSTKEKLQLTYMNDESSTRTQE